MRYIMRNLRNKLRGNHLLFLLLGSVFLTIAPVQAASPPTEISIGALLPISGSLSQYGIATRAALNQAIDDVQRDFNLKGYHTAIKVILEDTASDPATALERLKSLDAAGVKIVVGPASSGGCEATLGYANDRGMILVSPSSTAQTLAIAHDNLYRLLPSDNNQALAMAALMWAQGIRALVPIWREDVYGSGLKANLADAFGALGGTVYQGISYAPNATDFGSVLSQADSQVGQALASHGKGVVAVALIAYQEGVAILQDAGGLSSLSQAVWYGSDGLAKSSALLSNRTASAFAARVSLSTPTFTREDFLLPMPGIVLPDRSIREDVAARIGAIPDAPGYGAYDALWLTALAYETSGWSNQTSALKAGLEKEANRRVGLNGVLRLNQAGDLDYWSYGFYKVVSSGSGYRWSVLAAYNKDLGKNSLVFHSDPTLPGFPGPAAQYTIGALLPLSGTEATSGPSFRAGLEVALESINRHLAINGYRTTIKLDVRDTASDSSVTQAAMQALAADGVRVVMGPMVSSACQTVLPQANDLGLLLVSAGSTAPSLAIADDSLYRMVPSDLWQGKALALSMWEDGIRAAALIFRDDIWGEELSQSFRQAFTALGGRVLGSLSYSASAHDPRAYLPELDAAVAGGVQIFGAASTAVLQISFEEGIETLAVAGAYPALNQAAWYGADGLAQSLVLLANPVAAAFAAARGYTASIYALKVSGHLATYSIPRDVFFERVTEKLGYKPVSYAFNAWDSLWLAAAALMQSDWASEASIIGPALKNASDSYLGLSNFMALDQYGDRKYGDYGFYKVVKGASGLTWTQTGTYHFHPPAYLPPRITH